MIQAFRSAGTKIAAGIFALLMLVFVLTSVDWGQLATGGAVGKINGERIDARVYQTAVQRATDARQQQSAEALSLDDYAAIRDEVWEQFVQQVMLESEYERRGITVTADEIVEALRYAPLEQFRMAPEFQTDSQFDFNKYQRWLTTSAAQPVIAELEGYYRDQIRRNKLAQAVTADVYLSDAALWERYRDQNETVKIALTGIDPEVIVPDSAVSVTAEEIETYYRTHRGDFERPETAYLSYVSLPRTPNAADTAIARARIDSIRQEIVGGAPFAEVAQRESADTASAVRGGDLGKWARGMMDPVFDSAAFALPLNTLSQPVLSSFGFHLIEITSRKADTVSGRHILIPVEVAGEHRDHLDARADSLERLTVDRNEPAALDSAARALGLSVSQTGPVHSGTRVRAGDMLVPDAAAWAFDTRTAGATSMLMSTPWAYYVFRLDSLHPKGIPPLANIRSGVEAAVRHEKKRAQARKTAEKFLSRLASGGAMEETAKAMDLFYRELGPFARVNPPVRSPVVAGAAFGLAEGERSGLLDTPEGLYVIEVLEHTPADSAQFATELADIRARSTNQEQQQRIQAYLEALRRSAEVVDRRNEVRQQQTASGV